MTAMTTEAPAFFTTVETRPSGPFELRASMRFLEEFPPASRPGGPGDVLRLAFPVEEGWGHAGVEVRQPEPERVVITAGAGDAATAAAACAQARRLLSMDVDVTEVAEAVAGDRVAASVLEQAGGLRPVLFGSPYEAAVWAVIGQRLRMAQGAAIKRRIAERHGCRVPVGGQELISFPSPEGLRELDRPLGLPEAKIRQLRSLSEAAAEGFLNTASLRAMPATEALAKLCKLPGIGPFSAELILIRGAGHPDVFPASDRRLAEELALVYRADRDPARLADRWRPHRSWMAFLFRAARERRTGEMGAAMAR